MQTSGGTVPVQSSRVCVIYDSDSGRIHHVHEVITLKGGREPTEAEIGADAMNIARRRGQPPEKLGALHLPSDKLLRNEACSVDLRTMALVAIKPRK
jgi:hypothetical protein